jgi:putative methionine-R-sulfoxide reductase with GAF domain
MKKVFKFLNSQEKNADDKYLAELSRLREENRRLRQVTQRIAVKIGVHRRPKNSSHSTVGSSHSAASSHLGSTDFDDDEPPPPHLILAQAHRLQKLSELVVEISKVPDLRRAYRLVAQYTREIVGAARVSIAILQNDEGIDGVVSEDAHLEVFGLDGEEGAMPMGLHLPVTSTQCGHAVLTKQPVRVMDTADCECPDWIDVAHLHQMGVQAAIDVPLISSGRVIGTLNTGVTDSSVYYPEVEAMLLQIASVLASAMEKDRLYELAMAAQEQ